MYDNKFSLHIYERSITTGIFRDVYDLKQDVVLTDMAAGAHINYAPINYMDTRFRIISPSGVIRGAQVILVVSEAQINSGKWMNVTGYAGDVIQFRSLEANWTGLANATELNAIVSGYKI